MAIARKNIMDKERPGYYLITNRCVRQIFSLGKGPGEKLARERKISMEELLLLLCTVFCVRLFTFSFMDNHYHLVLFFDPRKIKQLSNEEVARLVLLLDVKSTKRRKWTEQQRENWVQLFIKDRARVRHWRKNLSDPSKFMAYFNEVVAKRFNKEDKCKGHFWQDRFHSVKLKDFGAVLMAASYVDLNPVRAGQCTTLLDSPHTSIRYRLGEQLAQEESTFSLKSRRICGIMGSLQDWFCDSEWAAPNLELHQYVRFLEDLGRLKSEGKGCLSEESKEVLARFDLTEKAMDFCLSLRKIIHHVLGSPSNMHQDAVGSGLKWHRGIGNVRELYLSSTHS